MSYSNVSNNELFTRFQRHLSRISREEESTKNIQGAQFQQYMQEHPGTSSGAVLTEGEDQSPPHATHGLLISVINHSRHTSDPG